MKAILLFLLMIPSILFAELRVVGTISDYAAIAKELGGERVFAESLIRGTQDPHFADAKPSLVLKVNKADLLICTGLGLENGWLPALLNQARNPKVLVGASGYLEVNYFVELKEVPEKVDRIMGDIHAGGNPHFYVSPDNIYRIAYSIYQALIRLDSVGKDYYTKKWKEFSAKYSKKSVEWRKRAEKLKGLKVIEYHKSWIYLIEWLGLQSVGALEPKPGIPPSASHITELLTKHKDISFVIQEVHNPKNLSELFAQKSGAKLVVLPSMVGALEGTDNIWSKFDKIIEILTK